MQLNFKTFGQGEPIIILHGLFGMLDNWQTIAKKLADTHTVFIVDQRNHGRSPHVEEHTYAGMADDLLQFMQDQFIQKAHILGHSMGGKTAMHFALNHPDQVDKLIVVDIAPKTYPNGHDEIFAALQSLKLNELESRKEIDEQLSNFISETGVRQFLMKNIERSRENGYALKMNLPVIYRDYPTILQEPELDDPFEGETLFIRGAKSRYVKDEDVLNILEFFPNARLETILDAGHWVHAERPQELLDLVKDFLAV